MNKRTYFVLDVFAEKKYTGNQLAVFVNGGSFSETEMQQIAKEINFSETAFILSHRKRNNGYDVRIFTPEHEVPFAGHPALGTAYVIQREIIQKPAKKIKLNLLAGQIPVAFKYKEGMADRLWMKQAEPSFGDTFDAGGLSEVLSLPVDAVDSRYPVQEVTTGLPFIIVPLKTLKGVRAARVDRDKYYKLIQDVPAKAIFIFSHETYKDENDLNARMFAEYYGIAEDPATGSANGCLAGYLVKYRYFDSEKISIRVEQGHEIGRPSLLYLRAEEKNGKIEVHVGGRVVMVARGEFL